MLALYSCAKDGQFISIIVHHQIASNCRKGTLFEGRILCVAFQRSMGIGRSGATALDVRLTPAPDPRFGIEKTFLKSAQRPSLCPCTTLPVDGIRLRCRVRRRSGKCSILLPLGLTEFYRGSENIILVTGNLLITRVLLTLVIFRSGPRGVCLRASCIFPARPPGGELPQRAQSTTASSGVTGAENITAHVATSSCCPPHPS